MSDQEYKEIQIAEDNRIKLLTEEERKWERAMMIIGLYSNRFTKDEFIALTTDGPQPSREVVQEVLSKKSMMHLIVSMCDRIDRQDERMDLVENWIVSVREKVNSRPAGPMIIIGDDPC